MLGSCLRLNAAIGDVLLILRVEDFYTDAHQRLFRGMVTLYDAGKPVDLVTLADELKRRGDIEDIGGYAYLAELWDAAPTAANAEHYARIVRDKALLRSLRHATVETTCDLDNPGAQAAEVLEAAERRIFAIAQAAVTGTTFSLPDVLRESVERIDAAATQKAAVLTGFLDLDRLTSGLHDGELVVLGARPSVGKTAMGLGIATNAAKSGCPVLFFSLEQSRQELGARVLCSEAKVDSHNVRRGKLSSEEANRITDAQRRLRGAKLFIDDSPGQTMLRIAANARRHRLREGIRLVVIDYLQLIEPEDTRRANRQEQVAAISRRLKGLSRELGIPVIILAQLNREVEHRAGERPRLSDLRESGAIEQDGDTVMLLHRTEPEGSVIQVIVAKQRNGPTGDVALTYVKPFMRFENFAIGDDPYAHGGYDSNE